MKNNDEPTHTPFISKFCEVLGEDLQTQVDHFECKAYFANDSEKAQEFSDLAKAARIRMKNLEP